MERIVRKRLGADDNTFGDKFRKLKSLIFLFVSLFRNYYVDNYDVESQRQIADHKAA